MHGRKRRTATPLAAPFHWRARDSSPLAHEQPETAEQRAARYGLALKTISAAACTFTDVDFGDWVQAVCDDVLGGLWPACWKCGTAVHEGPCVGDGDTTQDTGTQDDQIDPAVVAAMRKHIGESFLTPQGFADEINRLSGAQIAMATEGLPADALEGGARFEAAGHEQPICICNPYAEPGPVERAPNCPVHGLKRGACDDVWLIHFDDPDVPSETFTGDGAEAAAQARYDALSQNWSVTLLRTVRADPVDKFGGDPKRTTSLAGYMAFLKRRIARRERAIRRREL